MSRSQVTSHYLVHPTCTNITQLHIPVLFLRTSVDVTALGEEGVFFLTGELEEVLLGDFAELGVLGLPGFFFGVSDEFFGDFDVLGDLPTLLLGDVLVLFGDLRDELEVLGLPGFFFDDSDELFGDFASDFEDLTTLLLGGDILVLLVDLTDELGVLGLPGFFFGDNESLGDLTGTSGILGLPTFLLGDNLYFTGDFKVDGDLDGLPTLFGDSKALLEDFKAVESGVLAGLPTFLLVGDSKVSFGDSTEGREVPGDRPFPVVDGLNFLGEFIN